MAVNVATWTAFWNYDALEETSVDKFMTMDTYTGDSTLFVSRVENAVDDVLPGDNANTQQRSTGGVPYGDMMNRDR